MARHLPPSGSTLRLLDVGCGPGNSARELLRLRPDLRIVGIDQSVGMLRQARALSVAAADAGVLPFAEESFDAITAHSVYYLLRDPDSFLREARRVLRPGGRLILLDPAAVPYPIDVIGRAPRSALSVLAWHAVALTRRRVTIAGMARALESAGFTRVLAERSVLGCGVLSRGEQPYPTSSPLTRTANTAALAAVPGRYLFLLVQQTPNRPAWALEPGTVITWGAASVADRGLTTVLAFTALPKAVGFLQGAVLSDAIVGVNKVAKFERSVAEAWDFPILINPALDDFADAARFTLPGPLLAIDPTSAIGGDE